MEDILDQWESMTTTEKNEWIHIYVMGRNELSFIEGNYRYTEDMFWAWEVAKKLGIAAIPQSAEDGFSWYACDIKSVHYRGSEITIKPSNDSGISKETASEAICASAFLSVLAEL